MQRSPEPTTSWVVAWEHRWECDGGGTMLGGYSKYGDEALARRRFQTESETLMAPGDRTWLHVLLVRDCGPAPGELVRQMAGLHILYGEHASGLDYEESASLRTVEYRSVKA